MNNKIINWVDNDDALEKNKLFKKVFQENPDKNYKIKKRNPENSFINVRMKDYFGTLKNNILQKKDSLSQTLSLIGIISCYRGEGVSTIASNLAVTLAENAENRVLLIDINYRNPTVHKNFGLNLSSGLSDILYFEKDINTVIQSTGLKNLFIISAGEFNNDSCINFESNAFSDLLNSLKNEFSYVIFDTPAIDSSGSTARLAGLLDGIILVTESERVRWEAALRVKEQLIKTNTNIIGVILNKQQFHIPSWLYKTL